MSETNYQRLFGTPERAAETASKICVVSGECDGCPLNDVPDCMRTFIIAAWLREEARDD